MVVFDCAAEYRGISLNNKLVLGPDLINSLVGVLTKFRQESVALVGDAEQTFHQVYVDKEHREALRFLWWPDGSLENEPVPHQMTMHIFSAKSSPSCANFCLRETATKFGHLYPSSISEIVPNNFYVDDSLVSLPSVQEAIAIYKSLSEILAECGFHLRKWLSNNDKVLQAILESERPSSAQGHSLEDSTKERLFDM